MVKTATNPSVEATATTRSATERANRTNDRRDIDDAISRWEEMVQTVTDDGISEDQADIFASYADSLLLRWDLTHNLEDIQEVASNRGKALEKLPHSSTKRRYELLIRLGNVHQSWYQSFKDDPKVLLHAIQYWEEAHTLSVVLRQIKAVGCFIFRLISN
ncbi:hypothetical protein CPB86DRAFT_820866 [Serendipita vermifera]|nr:hypothetical protein CPB86DRAFT_820866 [Serendipita vermifera]